MWNERAELGRISGFWAGYTVSGPEFRCLDRISGFWADLGVLRWSNLLKQLEYGKNGYR